MSRNLVVIGAGGYAREVAYMIEEINRTTKAIWNIIGYWDNIARSEGVHIVESPDNGLVVWQGIKE